MLANARFANALGRPDAVYSASSAFVGGLTTVVSPTGGPSGNSPLTGNGRASVVALMALVVGYCAYTFWLRDHLL